MTTPAAMAAHGTQSPVGGSSWDCLRCTEGAGSCVCTRNCGAPGCRGKGAPPQVRETGRLADLDGAEIIFGVDHDAVTIRAGGVLLRFALQQAYGFEHRYAAAVVAALDQAGQPCPGACCPGGAE